MNRSNQKPALIVVASCLALFVASTLIGCQNAETRKLIGEWRLEGAEELAQLMTGGNRPAGKLGDLVDSAAGVVVEQLETSMEVEFASRGRLLTRASFGGSPVEKTGTWKTIKSEGDAITVWCQLTDEEPNEIVVTVIDRDTLKMVPPNIAVLNKPFTFKRVQK